MGNHHWLALHLYCVLIIQPTQIQLQISCDLVYTDVVSLYSTVNGDNKKKKKSSIEDVSEILFSEVINNSLEKKKVGKKLGKGICTGKPLINSTVIF